MWFNNIAERMVVLVGAVVVLVTFILANPMAMNSYRNTTAPYRGAASGGGTTAPPTIPPDPDPPPPSVGDKVVWAVGDTCDDQASAISDVQNGCKRVGNLIKADNTTARFLVLGDSQYEEGQTANYATYYDVGLGKQQIFAGSSDSIWDRTIAAVGNHEYLTAGAAPYYAYFGVVRSGDPNLGYFMTDLGKWRILSLNSNCSKIITSPGGGSCSATSAEGTWLTSQLQAATAAGDSTISIFHHPPYSDGSNYAPGTTSGLPLWQNAYDNGGDIVLCGHDHQYQRFGPLSRTGTPLSTGPQYWVSGTGGKNTTGFSTSYDRTLSRWGDPGSLPGALRLVLKDDGTFTFQYKTVDGTVRDSGSGTSR
jgi:hypothetical protein